MADILSVGIDIGTSTTQIIFSRLMVDNTAGYFSVPRVSIVDKEVVYRSAVHETPLKTPALVDVDGVRAIVAEAFRDAGYTPSDVDTGAVIITGEAARKENAAAVLEKLSAFAGEFVVSTAGPDLESIVAGKGSGAYQYSLQNTCEVANLDIGGGTTNIVRFDAGDTLGKACFDIGGRLIRMDETGVVTHVSPSAAAIARHLGVPLAVGNPITIDALSQMTDCMADILAQAVGLMPQTELLERVRTANASRMALTAPIRRLCLSGGVADCMRHSEYTPCQFGDIGVLLARSLQRHPLFSGCMWIDAGETIRATVVGAGTYTTTLSGSTIAYSPNVFPRKNIPVLRLTPQEEDACVQGQAGVLEKRVRWFLEQADTECLLLAMTGLSNPTYRQIKTLAGCIVEALDRALPPGEPILTAVEEDMAKALGNAMLSAIHSRRQVASIDSVKTEANDYVDIGRPMMDGLVVPVVVKTLLFG